MKINWISLVPAALLLVQAGAAIFGYTFDFGDFGNRLLTFVKPTGAAGGNVAWLPRLTKDRHVLRPNLVP